MFTSGWSEQLIFGGFYKSDHLLTLNRGESDQKILDGFAALKAVHRVLHGHPCASEDRRTAHNFRVAVKHSGRFHFLQENNLPRIVHYDKHTLPCLRFVSKACKDIREAEVGEQKWPRT